MALDVLNGKDIKDIPVVEKSPNLYIFNYDELKDLILMSQNILIIL